MERLQNNFTTPEQSKILLRLGVPKDSADCAYRGSYMPIDVLPPNILYSEHEKEVHDLDTKKDIREGLLQTCEPCWSAGRLMEILAECYMTDMQFRYFRRGGMMESLVNTFSDLRAEINFSALEYYGVGQCTRENKS